MGNEAGWLRGGPVSCTCSVTGWRPAGKPRFEVRELGRTLKGSSVPLPKALLKLVLTATLPRLLQRGLLTALPPELGEYLLDCGQALHIGGAPIAAHRDSRSQQECCRSQVSCRRCCRHGAGACCPVPDACCAAERWTQPCT